MRKDDAENSLSRWEKLGEILTDIAVRSIPYCTTQVYVDCFASAAFRKEWLDMKRALLVVRSAPHLLHLIWGEIRVAHRVEGGQRYYFCPHIEDGDLGQIGTKKLRQKKEDARAKQRLRPLYLVSDKALRGYSNVTQLRIFPEGASPISLPNRHFETVLTRRLKKP